MIKLNKEWVYKNKIILSIIGFIVFLVIIAPFVPKTSTTNNDSKVESNTRSTETKKIQKPRPTDVPKPVVVATTELIAAYDKNKLAAQEKYTGKIIQTTAYIDNISTDVAGNYYLSLRPTSDKYYFGTDISCYFADKTQKEKILALENGQSVTVNGEMADMSLGIVVINDCQIVESNISPTQQTQRPTTKTEPNKVPVKAANTPAPVSSETVSQKNVIRKAKSYLSYSAFSHDGLVAQLEYEQFSHTDAVYGVDNSGANWNDQAAKKAKSYMEYSAFSRGSLIEQLKYDKFTQEQAEYGANAAGL